MSFLGLIMFFIRFCKESLRLSWQPFCRRTKGQRTVPLSLEEKWVVAPVGMAFTKEEIMEQIHFQEQYFDGEIEM